MQGYVKYNNRPALARIEYGASNQIADDGYSKLANAILILAVEDWRQACRELKYQGEVSIKSLRHIADIRRLFKSAWGGMLCGDVDPLMILARLEKELASAQRKAEKLKAARGRRDNHVND